MEVELTPLRDTDVERVSAWFDDPDTVRWLGGRDWVDTVLRLVTEPAGAPFRGRLRVSCHPVLGTASERLVGFVDTGLALADGELEASGFTSDGWVDDEGMLCYRPERPGATAAAGLR